MRPLAVAVAALAACLALAAAGTLLPALLAVGVPHELDYGESIVYDHAARLLRGEPLYQPLDRSPFTVAAYTPLDYVLVAAARAVFGPGFGPGRAGSLLGGCVAAGIVWLVVARHTRVSWAGAIAASLFLALGFPGEIPWLAFNRVDLPGIALSLGAVAVLAGGTSRRRLLAAGLLAGLALLTKQTLISAALAGTLWLGARSWRHAATFAGTAALLVGVTGALLQRASDGAFLANTVWANVNPFSREAGIVLVAKLLVTQAGPLLWAALYLASAHPWRSHPVRLLVLYWLASAVPLIGLGKVGASVNFLIEFAAATSILAGIGIWHALRSPARGLARTTAPYALCLLTGAVSILVADGRPSTPWATPGVTASQLTHDGADFRQLIARVRREPKAVLGVPMDVIVLADRPITFEPLIYGLFAYGGTWSPRPLVERICRGEIGLLVVKTPIERTPVYEGYEVWPAAVMAALRQALALEGVQAGYYLYSPRQTGTVAPSGWLCESGGGSASSAH